LPPIVVLPGAIFPTLGQPSPAHLRHAVALRDAIPPALQQAARDALAAQAIILALILSGDAATREAQLKLIEQRAAAALARETRRLWPEVTQVAARARLPLADLALPGLRLMSPAQFSRFRDTLTAVIEHDQQVDLFEYVLQKMVVRHLEPHFTVVRKPVVQYYALKPLLSEAMVLLSALAYVGAGEASQAAAAFRRGAEPLASAARQPLTLLAEAECGLDQVDEALSRLAQASPQIKKNVLHACAQTVAADGVIQEREAELLRAMADTLDCPIPPVSELNEPSHP
jgi:hypothetical protein